MSWLSPRWRLGQHAGGGCAGCAALAVMRCWADAALRRLCLRQSSLYRSHMAVGSVLGAGRLWPYPPATLVLGPFPECVMEASSPKILGALESVRTLRNASAAHTHTHTHSGRCISEGADVFGDRAPNIFGLEASMTHSGKGPKTKVAGGYGHSCPAPNTEPTAIWLR